MNTSNYITVNIDSYLAAFVTGLLHGKDYVAVVPADHYIGILLYRLLDKVPEDCRFIPPVHYRKKQVKLHLNSLGARDNVRKRPETYYYLPLSKQIEFEKNIRILFDELFFNVVSITTEYTDEQIKKLIERFCEMYTIDYAQHCEALVKKYYRARMEKEGKLRTYD
ncbi:MAG: hypothetical protein LBQ74_09875 [Prevotella sp.]|jgi:hypothetical protein|nr:hypothetical protein [Prevotella sp.]